MGNTQYAVCHLQRGSGNDSGMSCHIERKDAKGKKYIPCLLYTSPSPRD